MKTLMLAILILGFASVVEAEGQPQSTGGLTLSGYGITTVAPGSLADFDRAKELCGEGEPVPAYVDGILVCTEFDCFGNTVLVCTIGWSHDVVVAY